MVVTLLFCSCSRLDQAGDRLWLTTSSSRKNVCVCVCVCVFKGVCVWVDAFVQLDLMSLAFH